MNFQRAIKVLIWLIVGAWFALLLMDHQPLTKGLFKPFSTVVSITLAAAALFDSYLWRWPLFRGWLVKRPVVDGTWKVELVSDWVNPETGVPVGTITAYIVVTQTLTVLTMRQLTKESTSVLVGTEIVCSPENVFCVSGIFRNTPKLEFRQRSPIHFGAVWLEVSDDDPASMSGHYWTDRQTRGPMKLTERKKQMVKTYEAAAALFP